MSPPTLINYFFDLILSHVAYYENIIQIIFRCFQRTSSYSHDIASLPSATEDGGAVAEQMRADESKLAAMALAMEPLCHTITTKAHFPKFPKTLIPSASFWESQNSHFQYNFPFPQEELSF